MSQKKLQGLSQRLKKAEDKIKELQEELTFPAPRPSVKIGRNSVSLKRAIIKPNFKNKTVLTDSTWRYVEIFLKENGNEESLFYWEQARNFCKATENLSLVSSPLTTYYTFLNATKALLVYKSIDFDNKHGVSGHREDGRYNLQNEHVILKPKGIVSSLSNYLKEPIHEGGVEYNLKKILCNLQFVHRAYILTYSEPDLFIPIVNPRFVCDKFRNVGWFEAELEPEHSNKTTLSRLVGFSLDEKYVNDDFYTIRRNKVFTWIAPRNTPTADSKKELEKYHVKIRKQLRYIYSPNNLWYVKRKDLKNHVIDRGTLPLIFIAMHRLSELSRYQPQILKKLFERSSSWLLSEFITKSMVQFVDQISSEITGDDFRMTGFRT